MKYLIPVNARQHSLAMPFLGFAAADDVAVHDPDVSEILLLTSVRETPFLDALPQAPRPATNPYHTWVEQAIGPDRFTTTAAVNSVAANTVELRQINGMGAYLQVGMLVEAETPTGQGEIGQISSIVGPNTVAITRGVASGRGISSLTANGSWFVLSTAELEGDDTTGDVSRPRGPKYNFTQIFKKPIQISGTRESVVTQPNVGSEIEYQERLRLMELLRDLEKAVIRGVALGNTIDDTTTRRTMNGVRALITSINSTVANATFTGDPLATVNAGIQAAWNNGARDLDILLCGSDWGGAISGSERSQVQHDQNDPARRRVVTLVETDFGVLRKIISPWMPKKAIMGLASGRIFVPNLRARNFKREELAKTGDSMKRHILGEYTVELHYQEQMFQISSSD